MGKDKLRIQECQFLKSALNPVLIGWNARSRCADFAGIFIIEKGAFCVELRPFYCNTRISVPMSYITGTNGRKHMGRGWVNRFRNFSRTLAHRVPFPKTVSEIGMPRCIFRKPRGGIITVSKQLAPV